jgi:hypothetical protein
MGITPISGDILPRLRRAENKDLGKPSRKLQRASGMSRTQAKSGDSCI